MSDLERKVSETAVQELMELMMPQLSVRMGEAYTANAEYIERSKAAEDLYELLRKDLSVELQELLEKYMFATIDIAEITGRIAYTQGMRDCFAILKALS